MHTPADFNVDFNTDCYGFNFQHSYQQLPAIFYKQQQPTAVKNPQIVLFNNALAAALNLDINALKNQGSQFLSGNTLCGAASPIAQAYAGHQFGGFNILGDGRAILLGEHVTHSQQLLDVQLKGAGKTPYSRGGDGRAALGPMLREYVISEAMYALGIPSTRSLAVTSTGENVYRNDVLAGAVLTRIAASHIRVGTFQLAATTQNSQYIKALADYTIHRHFPDLAAMQKPYLALLARVIDLQAALIAKWMNIGFIHGVMNTDNMSISGETIDYGPCAFMNACNIDTVFSSIDANGRYAFGNQPNIAHWNLTRLAETLIPIIDESTEKAVALATDCLAEYPQQYQTYWQAGMRKKLGLFNQEAEDVKLAEELLMLMQMNQADFTNTFKSLTKAIFANNSLVNDSPANKSPANKSPANASILNEGLFQKNEFKQWQVKWQARLSRQKESFNDSVNLMNTVNPAVIPRNHLVEEVLQAAVDGDLNPVNQLLLIIESPYININHAAKYTQAPDALLDAQYKTFCGT